MRLKKPWNSWYIFRQQGNYCLFKTCCKISILFSTKYCLFHNFIIFFSNNTFFIKHILKYKYKPGQIKVKCYWKFLKVEIILGMRGVCRISETLGKVCCTIKVVKHWNRLHFVTWCLEKHIHILCMLLPLAKHEVPCHMLYMNIIQQ
jgi:hypothetical protein